MVVAGRIDSKKAETGWDDAGRSLWKLLVRGVELPGKWIIVGREFRPAGHGG